MPQASCPHCQAVMSFTDDEARGTVIPCKRCEQRFRLPAGKAVQPAQRSLQDDDEPDDDDNPRKARKKSGPNWLLLGLVGGGLVVLLCGGVAGLGVYYMAQAVKEEMEEEAADVQKAKDQAVAVTAWQLAGEFQTNREAANLKYQEKYVRVQGIVDEKGKDDDGSPIVYLQGAKGPQAMRIACHFDGGNDRMIRRAQGLLKGRTVTILGQCDGQDGGDITLSECELVDRR